MENTQQEVSTPTPPAPTAPAKTAKPRVAAKPAAKKAVVKAAKPAKPAKPARLTLGDSYRGITRLLTAGGFGDNEETRTLLKPLLHVGKVIIDRRRKRAEERANNK